MIDYTHRERPATIVLTAANPVTVIKVSESLTAGEREHLMRCSVFPCESCQAYSARWTQS